MIEIQQRNVIDPYEFDVVVRDGGDETRHRVTMAHATFARLAPPGISPTRCIDAAFRFLLDREPKESILGSFDVTVIGRYFPDFELELRRYLR